MARLRAADRETEDYWKVRISGYLDEEHHPRQALLPRVIYVAVESDLLVGFVAGHLTRRYDCDGELQWIDVVPEHRRKGVASELLKLLRAWFAAQKAFRICVDPANAGAREFYVRRGAENLNKHWLVWNDVRDVLRRQKSDGLDYPRR
jgi:GNAT superfamily N-acetyltransferase